MESRAVATITSMSPRQRGSRRADAGRRYWRIAQYLMPCHGYTPSATEGQTCHAQCWVPIDDESCWVYLYSWNASRPLSQEERADADRCRRRGGVQVFGDHRPEEGRQAAKRLDFLVTEPGEVHASVQIQRPPLIAVAAQQ